MNKITCLKNSANRDHEVPNIQDEAVWTGQISIINILYRKVTLICHMK